MKKFYTKMMMATAIIAGTFSTAMAQTYEAVPAANSTVASLEKITITYPDAQKVEAYDLDMSINLMKLPFYEDVACTTDFSGNTVTITCKTPQTSKATYLFAIANNTYKVDGVLNTAISYNITVDPNAAPVEPVEPVEPAEPVVFEEYSFSPAEDEVTSIANVAVVFPKAPATPGAIKVGNGITIKNAQGVSMPCTAFDGYQACIVSANPTITEPGEYTVTIPAGTLEIDGQKQPAEITKTYTIKEAAPAEEIKIHANPEPGKVIDLENGIRVYFDNAKDVAYVGDEKDCATLEDAEGKTIYSYTKDEVDAKDDEMYFPIPADVTISGSVTLVIPAKVYTIDGKDGEEDLKYTYELINVQPAIYPMAREVSELTQVEFVFNGVSEVKESFNAHMIAARNAQTREAIATSYKFEENKVIINVTDASELVAGASYEFIIPPYAIEMEGQVYNKQITAQYTYTPEAPEFTDKVTPADNSIVTALDKFTIEFAAVDADEEFTVAIVETEAGSSIAPSLAAEGISTYYSSNAAVENNVMTFDFGDEAITTPAVYTLTVPGALYTINGIPGVDLVYTFTVADVTGYNIYPKQDEITEEPFAGIEVEFFMATEIKEEKTEGVTITDAEKQAVASETKVEGKSYFVNFAETATEGTYTFTIPAGTIMIDGSVPSPEIIVTKLFTPENGEDGIISVTASEANGAIHTISGVRVAKAVKGINIINGRKVLVK